MRAFTRALAATLATVVVILGILSALCNTVLAGSPVVSFLRGLGGSASDAAINLAVDGSGVKGRVDSALRDAAPRIAEATGFSESQVNDMIDELDIASWNVTSLPSGAVEAGSFSTSYQGVSAQVTTYSDPSYVTVSAAGQNVTLAVPSSAQDYIAYLSYL